MEVCIGDCKTLLGIENEDTISVNEQLTVAGNHATFDVEDVQQRNVESGVLSDALTNVKCSEEIRVDDENNRKLSSEDKNESESTGDKDVNAILKGIDRNEVHGMDVECGCDGTFRTKYTLQTRTEVHDEAKSYPCSICSKKFRHYCNLKTHTLIHTGERPYDCDVCGKSFRQMIHLRTHAKIHPVALVYRCEVCGKDFRNVVEVNVHMNVHTKKGKRFCKICRTWYERQSDYEKHLAIHANDMSFECEVCSKRFDCGSKLNVHVRIHCGVKPHACNVCSKDFIRRSDLKRHVMRHTDERPHACNVCNKGFIEMNKLRNHMAVHKQSVGMPEPKRESSSNEKSCDGRGEASVGKNKMTKCRSARVFKCRCCGKEFGNRHEFNVHFHFAVDSENDLPKVTNCCECGEEFESLGNLRMHYLVHSGAAKFQREICKQPYRRTIDMKKHSEKKPSSYLVRELYREKSFSDAGALRNHVHASKKDFQSVETQASTRADAGNESSEEKYDFSGDEKGSSTSLQELRKTEKLPAVKERAKCSICEYCGKRFRVGSELKRHRMIHTGEKPYKCDVCQRAFIEQHKLKLHARTHTGEKPYRCSVCSRCFARSYDLKRHKHLVHEKLD